jgi:hypothetical protein
MKKRLKIRMKNNSKRAQVWGKRTQKMGIFSAPTEHPKF